MGINFQKVSFAYYIPRKKQNIKFTLKDIDLNIDSSDEFITIVGHTGSGKSTLVQMMNALLLPTTGQVVIDKDILARKHRVKLKPIRKKNGLVFQFPEYQIFEETVLKDIMFGPKNFGLKVSEAEEKARVTAVSLGISEDLLERSPFNLSGGQMRKVAIAGILASNPDVLILDEPTVGLDPFGKKELLNLLSNLNKEQHKTIIIITHDMEVVSKYSKRSIVMNHGEVVFDGSSADLFKNEELVTKFNLDYPELVKTLIALKDKMNLDIDVYKYTVKDAYLEIKKAIGEHHE